MASFGTLLRAGGSLDLRRTRGILSAEGQFFLGRVQLLHGMIVVVAVVVVVVVVF